MPTATTRSRSMRAIELAVAWLGTYALHSTLLLLLAWALTRWAVRSHAAREAIWKAALVGGILTASVQVAVGFEPLLGRLSFAGERAAPATVVATHGDKALDKSAVSAADAEAVRDGVDDAVKAAAPRSLDDDSNAAMSASTWTTRSRIPAVLVGLGGRAAP